MTALRVIDDHQELTNVGSLTHAQIDAHVSGTAFVYINSSSNPPGGRFITAGVGISIIDGGPGGPLTISAISGSSGSGSGDNQAQYAVIQPTGSLPNARQIVTGSGIIITDDALNKTLTFSIDQTYIQSLFIWNEIPSGSNDGVNTTFTLANSPNSPGSAQLFVNGLLQFQGASADYVLSGSQINLNYQPRSGSNILCSYPRTI